MITIVDYGVGNTGALLNMFEYLGIDAETASTPDAIARARKLVLPGVGAFDKAMVTLRQRGLVESLDDAALVRRVPVLGVCLGMQLLARRSEEGVERGLGWIAADVRRIELDEGSRLKVPNMGWLQVQPTSASILTDNMASETRFYFDHGYHMACDDARDVAATIDYGARLCCVVEHNNIMGVQFHPEKSHRFGMRLLQAFAALDLHA